MWLKGNGMRNQWKGIILIIWILVFIQSGKLNSTKPFSQLG